MRFAKAFLRLIALGSALIFLTIGISIKWELSTDPESAIRNDCEYSIKAGDYSSYPEEKRMALCTEDSYKAAPLGSILSYFFIFLGLLVVLMNRRWLWSGIKNLSSKKDL